MARTLSVIAHEKVLQAAAGLFADRGIDPTSMDAIARSSGVSKATIYKHWQDKEALLLEVLKHINGLNSRPAFDSGNTRQDIIAVLTYRPKEDPALRDRITPHIVAYSATRAEFGRVWRNTILEPSRRELRGILSKAIEQSEIAPDLDFDTALALLLGPMLYSFIFCGKTSDGPREELAVAVTDAFLRAFGTTVGGVSAQA